MPEQQPVHFPHLPVACVNHGDRVQPPTALAPRAVIPPEGNGPFAQRTDLGWGIVGNACSSGENDDCHVHVCARESGVRIVLRTSAKEILVPENLTFAGEDRSDP